MVTRGTGAPPRAGRDARGAHAAPTGPAPAPSPSRPHCPDTGSSSLKKINNNNWGLFGRNEARPAPAAPARGAEGRLPSPEGSAARPLPQHHPSGGPAAAWGPRGGLGGEPRTPMSPPGTTKCGAAAGTPAIWENSPRDTGSGRGSDQAEAGDNRGKQNTRKHPKTHKQQHCGLPGPPAGRGGTAPRVGAALRAQDPALAPQLAPWRCSPVLTAPTASARCAGPCGSPCASPPSSAASPPRAAPSGRCRRWGRTGGDSTVSRGAANEPTTPTLAQFGSREVPGQLSTDAESILPPQ